MTATYQRIVLASRPQGWVTPENFRLERVPVPVPGPGQVLVRNHYLSLDPYMRGRMEESKSYAESQKLGETMIAAERWPHASTAFTHALMAMERVTTIPADEREKLRDQLGHRLGEAEAWVACEGSAAALADLQPQEQIKRVEAKLTEIHGKAIHFAKVDIKGGRWVSAELTDQPE